MFWREYSLYEELTFVDFFCKPAKVYLFSFQKPSSLSTFRPHSGYIRVFDGSGAQIFTREGCQKNHTSNTFLEIAFQESQNVTIQASLSNSQSYARVSYGILKNGLDPGEGLWNTTLSNHDDDATTTSQICIFSIKKKDFCTLCTY